MRGGLARRRAERAAGAAAARGAARRRRGRRRPARPAERGAAGGRRGPGLRRHQRRRGRPAGGRPPRPGGELARLLELHTLYFDKAGPEPTLLDLTGELGDEVRGLRPRSATPGALGRARRRLPGRVGEPEERWSAGRSTRSAWLTCAGASIVAGSRAPTGAATDRADGTSRRPCRLRRPIPVVRSRTLRQPRRIGRPVVRRPRRASVTSLPRVGEGVGSASGGVQHSDRHVMIWWNAP